MLKWDEHYATVLKVLGRSFTADLRGVRGFRTFHDPDSAESALVIRCTDYPGGFALQLDEGARRALRAALDEPRR